MAGGITISLLRGDSLTMGGGGLKNPWGDHKILLPIFRGIIEFQVSTIRGITKSNLIGDSKINIWWHIFKYFFRGYAAYRLFLHEIQLYGLDVQGIIQNRLIQTLAGQWWCILKMDFVSVCLSEWNVRWGDHRISSPLCRGIAKLITLSIGGIAR